MLDKKNKLIGITYATYDSVDSQNLNYAISIKYLQKLYKDLLNENYISLSSSNITNKSYKVSSMNEFYTNTNAKALFEKTLPYSWEEVYNTFDEDEKLLIIELYEEIENKAYTNHNPAEWETIDYLINLNVLPKKECAIVVSDIYKNATSNNVFNKVNNYSMSVFGKAMVLLLLGGYLPSDLANSDAELVVDTINNKYYSIEEKTIILEHLGYRVNGTNVNW